MKRMATLVGAKLASMAGLATLMGLSLVKGIPLDNQSPKTGIAVVITSPRPLYDLADLLEGLYIKPVSYEDPAVLWGGDIHADPLHPGLYLINRSFAIPAECNPGLTPALDAALLGRAVDAYHHQTDGPRFRISTSRWGLHILPAQVRNANGRWQQAASPLDAMINIPIDDRTPEEHFEVFCEALTSAAGIAVKPLTRTLDSYFAPNGILPPHGVLKEEDKKRISIAWGATNMIAREALITLLELSGTTMSWRLWCNPEPWDRYYILILKPIMITVTDRNGKPIQQPLTYDRCVKCPSLLPGKR